MRIDVSSLNRSRARVYNQLRPLRAFKLLVSQRTLKISRFRNIKCLIEIIPGRFAIDDVRIPLDFGNTGIKFTHHAVVGVKSINPEPDCLRINSPCAVFVAFSRRRKQTWYFRREDIALCRVTNAGKPDWRINGTSNNTPELCGRYNSGYSSYGRKWSNHPIFQYASSV